MIKIAAVGDVALIGQIDRNIKAFGASHPFRYVADVLKESDVVFGNLEMPFSNGNGGPRQSYQSKHFFHRDIAIGSLKYGGFSVLSLANNHIMECGKEGLGKTLDVLKSHQIQSLGAGRNLEEARKGAVLDFRGVKVGFLAYSMKSKGSATTSRSGFAPIDSDDIVKDVSRLKKESDFVVISLHFGLMYIEVPSPNDVVLCHRVIDAGVDVILGHHPHVLQGIERYKDGIIAYSLGELLFDRKAGVGFVELGSEKRRESVILNLFLEKGRPVEYEITPTYLNDTYQVEVAGRERKRKISARIEKLSERLISGEDFYEQAGRRLVGYEIGGLLYHLKAGNLAYLFSKLVNLRLRHLRLFIGFLKAKTRKAVEDEKFCS